VIDNTVICFYFIHFKQFDRSTMDRIKLLSLFFILVFFQWQQQVVVARPFTIPDYGRWLVPTVGDVWPKPQQQTFSSDYFILRPTLFNFKVNTY
jgi:hypothetical protein